MSWLTRTSVPSYCCNASSSAALRLWIEVVRRLVEQQHVVPGDDEPGKRQLGLLAAGERAGVLVDLVGRAGSAPARSGDPGREGGSRLA